MGNPTVRKALLVIILLLYFIPTIEYFAKSIIFRANFGLSQFLKPYKVFTIPDGERLLKRNYSGVYGILHIVNQRLPSDAKYLVFRPSEFTAYTDRRYVSLYDPALIPVYSAKSAHECHKAVMALDVDYIYLPPYSQPFVYNTPIFEVLADLSMTQLIASDGGYRIYRVLSPAQPVTLGEPIYSAQLQKIDGQINKSKLWTEVSLVTSPQLLQKPDGRDNGLFFIRNKSRDSYIVAYSGAGGVHLAPSHCFFDSNIEASTNYVMQGTVSGMGIFNVYIAYYDRDGNYIDTTLLWDSVLNNNAEQSRKFAAQFNTPRNAAEFRLLLSLRNKGWLSLGSLDIHKVGAIQLPHNYAIYSKRDTVGKFRLVNMGEVHPLLAVMKNGKGLEFMDEVSETIVPSLWNSIDDQILYTGKGNITNPPSSRKSYRIRASLRGKGVVEISLIGYGAGVIKKQESLLELILPFGKKRAEFPGRSLGFFQLMDDKKSNLIDKIVDVPSKFNEFRVAIKYANPKRSDEHLEVAFLTVYENTAKAAKFSGEVTPEWRQVYPYP